MANIEKINAAEIVDIDFDYFVDNKVSIPSGGTESTEIVPKKSNKKIVRAKKGNNTEIAENGQEIINMSTLDSYADNMNELKKTVLQLDSLASELKEDLDAVRSSRTIKGKYQYTSMIANNISSILATKAQAIREMNNTIKSSIELDYKIEKDRRDQMNANDDKRIMDMYNAFISSPISTNQKALLGPSEQQITTLGNNVQMVSGRVVTSGGSHTGDAGYDNYINNLTPEQNYMMYENNPDIKEVVVYNEDTGERFFDIRNIKTGESIPNMPIHDAMFLEDTLIDKKRNIARNVNLGETYPLVVVGGNSSNTQGF